MIYEVDNINTYKDIVADILEQNNPPLIICLTGDLGAGKTTFTQAFGEVLNVDEVVKSPSYVIQHEYVNRNEGITVHHLDLYRLEARSELQELRIHELIKPDTYVIIEWADKFEKYIQQLNKYAKVIWINFEHLEDEVRILEVKT